MVKCVIFVLSGLDFNSIMALTLETTSVVELDFLAGAGEKAPAPGYLA